MNLGSCNAAHGLAIARATDSMLRSLGGSTITMLLPMRLDSSDATSTLEEVELSPVVLRSMPETRFELLVGATAAARLAETRAFGSAAELFEAAVGFEHDDSLLRIAAISVDCFAGEPYLYRLALAE
jgi:hypothetical protein